MYVDELYHHGIKGMHWGVRRFQNRDGSLTKAGFKRYRDDDGIIGNMSYRNDFGNSRFNKRINKQNKKDRIEAAKNSSQLSDDELNKMINRLQKEKQLKDLTNQTVAPGRKRVKDFLIRNGEAIAATTIAAYLTNKIAKKANTKPYDEVVNDEYLRQKAKRDAEDRLIDEEYYELDKDRKMKRKHKKNRNKH